MRQEAGGVSREYRNRFGGFQDDAGARAPPAVDPVGGEAIHRVDRGEVEFVTPGTMWDVKFKGESEKYRLYIFEPDCKGASDCIETYRVQGEIAFKKVAVNCNLLITQVLSENPLDNSARGVCKDQVDRSYSITVFK